MHSLAKILTIKVIDCYLYLIYYIDSTEQIKCSKTKSFKATTASRKPLFHKKNNQKHQTKVTPQTSINTLPI